MPILSHLFGAEFGLEILLEIGRLSSQLDSIDAASVATCGVNTSLAKCLYHVFNVKALVGPFNQEKARDCENRLIVCSSRY